ncbi:MAG: hypothetical protein MH472_03850 [Bacteroidia bacterium]|nr:hypothetical protein [Bacteroidia bacterium]
MTAIESIISTINHNLKSVSHHVEYPNKPGLYAFVLAPNSNLKNFGSGNQIIYVGKAEDSLRKRDLNTHFKDGRTGHSTLRRSIGAVLKNELKAVAFSRNGTLNRPNIDNYKFNTNAEAELSDWMKKKLRIGYWEYNQAIEKKSLRDIEVELIIALKPTLDLDKQTARFNKNATSLSELRKTCKNEAKKNVLENIAYF